MQVIIPFLCVWIASSTIISCTAKTPLPAPTALTYTWRDPFTLNVSWIWEKPVGLPDNCEVVYNLNVLSSEKRRFQTSNKHYTDSFLTKDLGVLNHWKLKIQVVGLHSCLGSTSTWKNITVHTKKPTAKLVKDFQCLINQMLCSWIPVDSSPDVTVSYRYCGSSPEDVTPLKKCDHINGGKNSCILQAEDWLRDVCVLVESDGKLETFKAELVIPLQKMSITKEGDHLNLRWIPPDFGRSCGWNYEICYKECNRPQSCQIFEATEETTEHEPFQVLYDKFCLYEFEFNSSTNEYCLRLRSDRRGYQTYGANVNPWMSMIWFALSLSFVLSVSVVLSLYCFRRHCAVSSPLIPDPSSIFKDMMSGYRDTTTAAGIRHMHVPQPEETCKITVVTKEDSVV